MSEITGGSIISQVTHRNINVYTNKVTSLKKQFANQYKTDKESAITTIKQMRTNHGIAIYDDFVDKVNISKKGIDSTTDDDWIKLSANASLLHVIHNHIRYCERLLFNYNHGNLASTLLSSDTEMQTMTPSNESDVARQETSFQNALTRKNKSQDPFVDAYVSGMLSSNTKSTQKNSGYAKINRTSMNTDELSLDIPSDTVNATPIRPSDLFSETDNGSVAHNDEQYNNNDLTNTANTSEYIKNLTSSEAARLASEYDKNKTNMGQLINQETQTGGAFNKTDPTLINYYATWCGYSQKFLPVWEEFKNKGNKHKELQITDMDVGTDKELNRIASEVGVKGYPTIVLFYKGKTYPKVASSLTVEDINNFVKSIIST
jgi:thiol-disulfide isomerase/thioredoxin